MADIKAIVSFTLPGSVMYTTQECVENPNLLINNNIKVEGKIYNVQIRKTKPAVQKLKISEANYRGIVKSNEPEGFKYKNPYGLPWKALSGYQKFHWHMSLIAHDLGACFFKIDFID